MELPPLNALRAFESAGRHQSFLLAAKELCVSSASISRFVKLLENYLGHSLFERKANGVSLTKIGTQYLLSIQPHLQNIAMVSQETKKQNNKTTLTIISIPAIAETWLISRLWDFQQQHKDIQINLVVDDQLVVNDKSVTLHPNDATIVLNYSNGNQVDTESFAMPKDKLTLICNPKIASSLTTPEDILNQTLLVDIDWRDDWTTWLQATFGQSLEAKFNEAHRLDFERYSMVLHAALAGSGVAIGHTALLESYLQSGALVAPFAIEAVAKKQFYALTAVNSQRESVKDFISWFSGYSS